MLVTEAALLESRPSGPLLTRLPSGAGTSRNTLLASLCGSWASGSEWGRLLSGGCPVLAQDLDRTKTVKVDLGTPLGSWGASVSWQAPEGASCPQAVPSGEALRHGGGTQDLWWGVPGTAELGSSLG